jgi:hypothetical protein
LHNLLTIRCRLENTPHNRWHLAAAALMGLTTLVHTFLGGPEINAPIRASTTLAPEMISVLTVVWHIVTANLAILTLALAWLARHPNTALANVLLAMTLSYVALFVGYGLADLGNVTTMPQWTGFAVIAALIVLGQRRAT